MTNSERSILEKVSMLNYKIATHEGSANCRLASQAHKIISIPHEELPDQYRVQFKNLKELINKTVVDFPYLMIPIRIKGIYNKTAVKYLILLIEIEDYYKNK